MWPTAKPHQKTKKSFFNYLSELRRDFLASIGITYAVFRIAKLRLRVTSASSDVILVVRIFNWSASGLTTFVRNHWNHV